MAVPCFARQDIKIFDRIGHDGIVKILGQPISTDGMEGLELLEYPGNAFELIDSTDSLLVLTWVHRKRMMDTTRPTNPGSAFLAPARRGAIVSVFVLSLQAI